MVDRRRVTIDRVLETQPRALDNAQVVLRAEKANPTLSGTRSIDALVAELLDPLSSTTTERLGVGILAQDAVCERLEVFGRRIPHRRQQADQPVPDARVTRARRGNASRRCTLYSSRGSFESRVR